MYVSAWLKVIYPASIPFPLRQLSYIYLDKTSDGCRWSAFKFCIHKAKQPVFIKPIFLGKTNVYFPVYFTFQMILHCASQFKLIYNFVVCLWNLCYRFIHQIVDLLNCFQVIYMYTKIIHYHPQLVNRAWWMTEKITA